MNKKKLIWQLPFLVVLIVGTVIILKSNLLSAQTKDLFSVQSIKSPTKVTKI